LANKFLPTKTDETQGMINKDMAITNLQTEVADIKAMLQKLSDK